MHPSMINALRNLERKINVLNLIKDTYEIYGKPVIIVVQSLSGVWLLWSHGHTRLPCPALSPGVCSDSCPLSGWCYLTISSSAAHFSFCLQSFPASGSFPMSQLFASGGQSIGASASASLLPMSIQCWFPLGLIGIVNTYLMLYWRFLSPQIANNWISEIQPVHSEGDQPWDFFGRNDAKAETPVVWPPHEKSWLIGKDCDAGRDWGQEEKGTTEDEMAGWQHWLDGRESE